MKWLWICLIIISVFAIICSYILGFFFKRESFKSLINQLILWVITIDCICTLAGQQITYWKNYLDYTETSFVGALLLNWHPLAFTLGIIVWILFVVWIINQMSFFFYNICSLALLIGHSFVVWDSWIQSWLFQDLEIFGYTSQSSSFRIAWEGSQYLFCIFLGLILCLIVGRARHFK